MNDINQLRTTLFDTMNSLKDKTITPAEAKAITNAAQTIINSVKIEIDLIKAVGGIATGTGFIPLEPAKPDMEKFKSKAEDIDEESQ